jgi:hypothetical protein
VRTILDDERSFPGVKEMSRYETRHRQKNAEKRERGRECKIRLNWN